MSLATMRWAALVSLIVFISTLSGCNYFRGNAIEDDDDVTEIDELDKAEPLAAPSREFEPEAHVAEGVLELKLKVGDRFPLSKTVEHRLTQTENGVATEDRSLTELMLSLVVDEVRPDGKKLLTVQYHRVNHQQEIRGKRISYSSERPTESIPPEAYLYSGLANNRFSFWIGTNNNVIEVVGFNDFLRRCLQNVPPQYANSVKQQLESTRNEDGIANFIDDSIGLLPFNNDPDHPGVAVKEGSHWKVDRFTKSPVPISISTDCILKELTANSAEISLAGRMSGPQTPVVIRGAEGNVKVMVKGGHCTGSCRVDRQTGLPTQSHVIRTLDMAMELPGGQVIQQNKESISTIRSFLNQQQAAAERRDSRVQQTNLRTADGAENHRRVIQAGGPRPSSRFDE